MLLSPLPIPRGETRVAFPADVRFGRALHEGFGDLSND